MNQKGFITVSALAFLPFLTMVCFVVFFHLWFTNQKNQLENLCRKHVLAAQESLVTGNEALLAQNWMAKALIESKKVAKKLQWVPHPATKAAARLALKFIRVQQTALNLTQQASLKGGELFANKEAWQLRFEMQRRLRSFTQFWGGSLWATPRVEIDWPESAVEVDEKDTASTYKRVTNHEEKQTLSVRWSYPLDEVLPDWINRLVSPTGRWIGECHSHPHKGAEHWYATIGKAKHSLRPSFLD